MFITVYLLSSQMKLITGSNTSIGHVDTEKVPGYTWQHKGRPTLKKYKNVMLFVDHKTRLVYPSFQESKTASGDCCSKCDYETFSKRYNITIDYSHADNGAFRSETFQKSIDYKNQKLNFSGVNAQWQNGLVERSNGTLCAAARSMINHAISQWDKTVTAELWPFAIQHAATIYNTTYEGPETANSAHGNNSWVNALNLTKPTCTHYSVQSMCLTDACN
jgi:hypothetical protein